MREATQLALLRALARAAWSSRARSKISAGQRASSQRCTRAPLTNGASSALPLPLPGLLSLPLSLSLSLLLP